MHLCLYKTSLGMVIVIIISRLSNLSLHMRKPTVCILCIGENKGADQLRSNCEAVQRLCFRFMDSTIPQLSKSKISCFCPSVLVQHDLCQTRLEPKLLDSHSQAQLCLIHGQVCFILTL